MRSICTAELGIDLQGILRRSLAVLTHRLGSDVLLDLDLGGPLFFAAILGSVHLLVTVWHYWNHRSCCIVPLVAAVGIDSRPTGL